MKTKLILTGLTFLSLSIPGTSFAAEWFFGFGLGDTRNTYKVAGEDLTSTGDIKTARLGAYSETVRTTFNFTFDDTTTQFGVVDRNSLSLAVDKMLVVSPDLEFYLGLNAGYGLASGKGIGSDSSFIYGGQIGSLFRLENCIDIDLSIGYRKQKLDFNVGKMKLDQLSTSIGIDYRF